jgi:hypothetical protein
MAIEPAGIVQRLKLIEKVEDIEPCLQSIYVQLPTCINRAVGTLQCTQLEMGYKGLMEKMKIEYDFDLHQAFKNQVALILARKR